MCQRVPCVSAGKKSAVLPSRSASPTSPTPPYQVDHHKITHDWGKVVHVYLAVVLACVMHAQQLLGRFCRFADVKAKCQTL